MAQRTDDDPDWGAALAVLRIVRGWTQGQLQEAVGLAHSRVSSYEVGARTPPLALLRQMVAAMGFPARFLDRARSLVRWARAVRQLYREPARDTAAACIEVMAATAGQAREELARAALAGALAETPVEPPADGGEPLGQASSASSPAAWPGAPGRVGGGGAVSASLSSAALPQALRVLRLIAGLEREELAAAVGMSKGVIQTYERGRGKRTPLAATVQKLLDGMDLPPEVLDRTLRFLAEARAARRWYRREGAASLQARIEDVAAGEAAEAEDSARAWPARLQAAASLLAARRRAPALWARLQGYPDEARRALVREAAEFQDAGLCELLCEESLRAAGDSAEAALRLAELAVLAAERVPGTPGWRRRCEGYAEFHMANARRVPGNLLAAEESLARAAELWQAGAADDPGLLNEARVLHLEASLRRAQRKLPEALALLDRALAADHWGETPSLLLGKAKALEELGDFAAAIALLRQAAPQIDGEGDLVKLFSVHLNLAAYLCHLGRHAEAALGLPEVRALARRLGNQLDGLRVTWLEAKVAAGLGRIAEAVAGFERVRAEFEERGFAYDAALATLELAELHASLGRTADVKVLARRSAPIFQEQGVHREAQRALELFRRAAEEERVSVELVRSVLAYLQRARHDPQLRFQEVA
jgi:transcriptional regulator with XRE-family HTH domain